MPQISEGQNRLARRFCDVDLFVSNNRVFSIQTVEFKGFIALICLSIYLSKPYNI